MAKLVKPNKLRGQIFDKLAECFGDSVLGMCEGKLRVEVITEEGEVVQFSLAPVVHKTLVEEDECDKYVAIADQIATYEAAQGAKTAANVAKKDKAAAKTTKETPVDKEAVITIPVEEAPVEISEEEQKKLDELSNMLDGGTLF